MDNKKGQAMWFGLGLVVVLIILGVVFVPGILQSISGGDNEVPVAGCRNTPTITYSVFDELNKGTSVSGAVVEAIVNGQYKGVVTSGTTKFQKGQEVELLVGAANYLNKTLNPITIDCDDNQVITYLYATDDGTLTVFNDGGNAVTNQGFGGAGTNQSESTTPIQNEIKLTANTDESLGDVVAVLEYSNKTEVDDLVLSGDGVSKTSIPETYTEQGTNNIVRAYEISNAPMDGVSKVYYLNIEPATGYQIGAGNNGVMNITMYTKQWFVEKDGTFAYGIENVDGTAKYEDVFTFGYTIWTS